MFSKKSRFKKMAQRKNMGRMFHVKQRRKGMGERGYFLRAVYKTEKKGYNSKKTVGKAVREKI